MFRNHVKIALRHLLKQKGLAAINVLSLSIGLACFSLFLLYTVNEFSFDRFHGKADRIFRMYTWSQPHNGRGAEGSPYMPMPLGPALQTDFPEIAEAIRFREDWGDDYMRVDGKLSRMGIAYADPAFFRVFDFPIKYGDAQTALADPSHVVLTEAAALRLFGEANPVGRTLEVRIDDAFVPFRVSAVAEDLPQNSSIQFAVLGSFDFYSRSTTWGKRYQGEWNLSAFHTYVLLREGSGLAANTERLQAMRAHYYPNEEADFRKESLWKGQGAPVTFGLQPVRNIHTDTHIGWDAIEPKNVWTLLAIAAGVLLIACINFTTLAIGRSAGRAREVGVRKVIGSSRRQLAAQFLTEAGLLAGVSGLIGVTLAQAALPWFNELAGRDLVFSLKQYPELASLLLGFTLLAGLLAGSYPALVLSGFKPVAVLKSRVRLGGANWFTRSLVTLQFVLSIGLIAATMIMLKQVDFMQSKNPGFQKENVVVVNAEGVDAQSVYPRLRQLVRAQPGVAGMASSEIGLGEGSGWSMTGWKFGDEYKEVYEYLVDRDFAGVMGLTLLAGRDFRPDGEQELEHATIINETMAQYLGWTPETAVGRQLTGYFDKTDQPLPVVVGVVKDFNFRSLREVVAPMMLHYSSKQTPNKFFVRLKSGDPKPALAALESAWGTASPGFPFVYSFLDDDLDRFYHAEERFSRILGWAGGISIFLACLGLFGLAALAAVNRTKEIGIRKVLGASVARLTGTLSNEFIRLVVLAFILAVPLTSYLIGGWLADFAYRIELPWWYFGLAGVLAVGVAFLTVSIQSVKAALANPVESLRSE